MFIAEQESPGKTAEAKEGEKESCLTCAQEIPNFIKFFIREIFNM